MSPAAVGKASLAGRVPGEVASRPKRDSPKEPWPAVGEAWPVPRPCPPSPTAPPSAPLGAGFIPGRLVSQTCLLLPVLGRDGNRPWRPCRSRGSAVLGTSSHEAGCAAERSVSRGALSPFSRMRPGQSPRAAGRAGPAPAACPGSGAEALENSSGSRGGHEQRACRAGSG